MDKQEDYYPSHEELESLFVNNTKLQLLSAHLSQFNPIKVMRMERMEIRHSAILAWLLDPRETHGLDDKFLKAFLSEALRGYENYETPISVDVTRADLKDAEIRREWNNIDIFIRSVSNNWGFIIENKFFGERVEAQLEKYAEKLNSIFSENERQIDLFGVFLTLDEEAPEGSTFATIYYSSIVEIISALLEQNDGLILNEVKIFLLHYLEILKDATGMNEKYNKMEKLARELYIEHKRVLDFVVAHGTSTDFAIAARSVFGENPELYELIHVGKRHFYFGYIGNSQASFLPEIWCDGFDRDDDVELVWEGCDGWWMEYPLICWFEIRNSDTEDKKGKLWLYAEVGPLNNHDVRKTLIGTIEEAAQSIGSKKIKFQSGATTQGKRYSKFLKQNNIEVEDVQDSEEIASAMNRLLDSFRKEFDAIGERLESFHEYGKIERN